MDKYILTSVLEREITTSYHATHKSAYAQMIKELDETGDRADYTEGDDYAIGKNSAWSNMDSSCNGDWLIENLPGVKPKPSLSESMEDMLNDKTIITYQDREDDGEIHFILIIYKNDFEKAMAIIERAKESFDYNEESEYEMLSDAVFYGLKDAGIKCLMPDFEEL